MLAVRGYDDASRAVAAHDLPAPGRGFPDEPLTGDAWKAFSAIATTQRLGGLLGRAVADGAVSLSDEHRAEAEQWELSSARTSLFLERALLEVWQCFEAAAIPVRVLKGPALAHTVYPAAAMRPFGDVDILVPGEHFDRAVAKLVDGGGARSYGEPRPGFTSRFGKGVSLTRRDGYEIDVHRTFVSGPYGLLVDTPPLFTGGSRFRIGGRDVLGLEREAQFVGSCYHAVLGSAVPRLLPLRDVLQIALTEPFDLSRARTLWESWRGDAVVALAVSHACNVLGVAPTFDLAAWAKDYRPTPREQHYLDLYVDSSRSYARQALAGVGAIRGVRAKAAYVTALAAPSGEYLRARDGSYIRRAWRAGRLAVTRSGR